MSETGWKWLRRVVLAALALEISYLIGANVFLNTGIAPRLINRQPEKLWIHWQRAWTLVPGIVQVRDLRLRGQDRRLQWYVELDAARTRLSLAALAAKRFRAHAIEARGLTYRMRRRLPDGAAPPADADLVAPIPGLANPPVPPPEGLYPTAGGRRPWTLDLRDVVVREVRSLWIDRWRFDGEGRVDGELLHVIRGPLALPRARVHLRGGLRLAGTDAARDLNIEGEIALERFVPREHKGREMLRFVSADLRLHGMVDELAFLRMFFREASALAFRGRGALTADLKIARGLLTVGTRLSIQTQDLAADVFGFQAQANEPSEVLGVVEQRGDSIHARLNVALRGVAFRHADRLLARGEGITLSGSTSALDLREPFTNLRVTVELPGAELPDARVLNAYLSRRTGLSLHEGRVRLRARFEGLPRAQLATGTVELSAEQLRAAYGALALSARLEASGSVEYGLTEDQRGVRLLDEVPFELTSLTLRLDASELRHAEHRVAEQIALTLDSRFDRSVLDASQALGLLRSSAASLRLAAHLPDATYLNPYLPPKLQLRVAAGAAELRAQMQNIDDAAYGSGSVTIDGKRLTLGFREFTLGGELQLTADLRYGPGADAAGGLIAHATGPLVVAGARARLHDAALQLPAGIAARGLDMQINTRFAHLDPRPDAGREALAALSGSVRVTGQVPGLGFLRPYFRKAPWLTLQGTGTLDTELHVERGVLAPGSRLSVRSQALRASYLDYTAAGSGSVAGSVRLEQGRPTASVTVALADFEVGRSGHPEPHIFGHGFTISSKSTALDLREPFTDLEVTLDLPDSSVPDLSVYNAYIPLGAGIAFHSGRGRIRSRLHASAAERSAYGEIEFTAKDIVGQVEEVTVAGELRVHARLRNGELEERRFDFSGTRVELKDSYVGNARVATDHGWWGRVILPQARGRLTTPLQLQAQVEIEARDSRPLVVLLAARKPVVAWFKDILTVNGLLGQGQFEIGPEAVALRDLELLGDRLHVLGELDLSRERRSGVFYAQFRNFSVAVELRDDKRDWKLTNSRAWFDARRAAYRQERRPLAGPGTALPASP